MPTVSIAKVFQRLASGQIDPLYLFFGDEPYLIQEYTTSCANQILGTAPRDFNYDVFTPTSGHLHETLSLAKTLPIMTSHRVLVCHDIHKLRKGEMHELEAYAASPSETTALICTTESMTPQKAIPQFFRQAVAVECKRLEGSQLRNWASRFIEQQGYRITPQAVHTFLQDQQNDLWTLKRELEKLCTYCGDKREIGLAEIHEICQPIQMHSIFALTNAIGSHQIGQAFSLIDKLMQQGEPPLIIFSMMVRHVRLLWSIKGLGQQGENTSQMAKTLRLPPHVCQQLANQCKLFSTQRLQELYQTIVKADLAFKTTNKAPKAILEDLTLRLCSEP